MTAMSLAMDTAQPPVFSCGMSVAPVTNWLLYGNIQNLSFCGL